MGAKYVIHTSIAATADDEGLPATAAIDRMDADEDGLSEELHCDLGWAGASSALRKWPDSLPCLCGGKRGIQ